MNYTSKVVDAIPGRGLDKSEQRMKLLANVPAGGILEVDCDTAKEARALASWFRSHGCKANTREQFCYARFADTVEGAH